MIPMDTLNEKKSWLMASRVMLKKRPNVTPSRLGVMYTRKPWSPVRVTPEASV